MSQSGTELSLFINWLTFLMCCNSSKVSYACSSKFKRAEILKDLWIPCCYFKTNLISGISFARTMCFKAA
ncbi:hypothetical protein D918_01460 [Trichuris suis]|nr:hypothetical protein D918_01460 [Trichuris suis]